MVNFQCLDVPGESSEAQTVCCCSFFHASFYLHICIWECFHHCLILCLGWRKSRWEKRRCCWYAAGVSSALWDTSVPITTLLWWKVNSPLFGFSDLCKYYFAVEFICVDLLCASNQEPWLVSESGVLFMELVLMSERGILKSILVWILCPATRWKHKDQF